MLELFDGGEQKKNGTYACREKGMPCAAILIELIRGPPRISVDRSQNPILF